MAILSLALSACGGGGVGLRSRSMRRQFQICNITLIQQFKVRVERNNGYRQQSTSLITAEISQLLPLLLMIRKGIK